MSDIRITRSQRTRTNADGTKTKTVIHEVTMYGFDCGGIHWSSDTPDLWEVRTNVSGWDYELRRCVMPEYANTDSLRAAKKLARALAPEMYRQQTERSRESRARAVHND